MSSSNPQFTPAQWDVFIDQFHASGLSQVAFCKAENLARYSFAYHYRRSDKFAGIRRNPAYTDKTNEQKGSGFRSVQHKATSGTESEPLSTESVLIHIGDDAIRFQCSATVGVEAIVRLVREARS